MKYSKNKETKKIDYTKPPSIKAKVPCYGEKWAVELYDTNSKLIFPSEDPNQTPPDFVPKMSNIACVLQCGGIWIGGKGWGLTWKMIQGVVKPKVTDSVYGRCHINLSTEDKDVIDSQPTVADDEVADEEVAKAPVSTEVEDSDAEEEPVAPTPAPSPAPAPPKKVVVKKAPVAEPVAEPVVEAKKVVVKKKVVAGK